MAASRDLGGLASPEWPANILFCVFATVVSRNESTLNVQLLLEVSPHCQMIQAQFQGDPCAVSGHFST
jgi:hypothetical protein